MSTMGPPLTTSSPKNKPKQQARNKITKRSLRLLIINFQSIKSKKENFWNMLEQTEPDIIIASETWLHQGILEREILPENYRFVARRDRLKSAHGGVAVIAKSDLDGVEVDTPSDTEFVAASFTCKYLKKPLIVGSLYRPPENNKKYAEDLCKTISSLSTLYRDSTIWIGGDANLPDIEWDTTHQ
jgi:exonuclease III